MAAAIRNARPHAVEFFDRQFRRQVAEHDYALNPFERLVLPHARGDVLDLGCGLGNFALEAARRGCRVVAVDASRAAIEDVRRRGALEGLAIDARCAEAAGFAPRQRFDVVACIGLLMFFDCATAERILARLLAAVRPGGMIAVNVLVRGTTYLDMFDAASHCLWDPARLDEALRGWTVVAREEASFAAPGGTSKAFLTVVARCPAAAPAGAPAASGSAPASGASPTSGPSPSSRTPGASGE